MSVADTALVALDQPPEAVLLERERIVERLRRTDLGRGQPTLEALVTDPGFRAPALASPPIAAVLVEAAPDRVADVKRRLSLWGDVSVYTQDEEEALLLGGVVQRARMQIGLFTVILTLTAAVVVMMVMWRAQPQRDGAVSQGCTRARSCGPGGHARPSSAGRLRRAV